MNCLTSVSVIENSIHKFSPASGHEIPQNQKRKDVEEIAALFGDSLSNDKENKMNKETLEIFKEIMLPVKAYCSDEIDDYYIKKAKYFYEAAKQLGFSVRDFESAMNRLGRIGEYAIMYAGDRTTL